MTHPEPAGSVPLPGAPLITQADCWRRQRKTLRVLAGILDADPGLPAITWTVSWLGRVTGEVFGLGMPPEQARAIFTAWQQALRLENVKETPIRDTGIVSLSGRTYRGTVRVGLTARAYYPLPDDEASSWEAVAAEVPELRPRRANLPARHAATRSREPASTGPRQSHGQTDSVLGRSPRPACPKARSRRRRACEAGSDPRAAPPPRPDRRQRPLVQALRPRGPGSSR
jgi:hypothetical protein